MGHFIQAWRHGVRASLPYFIPMPSKPFGTFGAVIGMSSRIRDRRVLFDIGASGPLAGLVPAVLCCIVGLMWSKVVHVGDYPRFAPLFLPKGSEILPSFPFSAASGPTSLGWPLGGPLFHYLQSRLVSVPFGHVLVWHPLAYAGWVGLFITALNLIPIGQLDGGHVLYALLRRRAHLVAVLLLISAVVVVSTTPRFAQWLFMLLLLMVLGPLHPPTADDDVPLGPVRVIVGWLTLAFLVLAFTPTLPGM
jgi:membrane-associated protease RseP (regulator of RpoE activity)